MGAVHHNAYLWESKYDPASGKHVGMVGARCKKCNRTEWLKASNPGWGRRLFKQKGWILGNGVGTHVCPRCEESRRSKPKAIRQEPEGRVIAFPPSAAPTAIASPPPTPEPEPVNTALAEALAPVKREMERKKVVVRSRGAPSGFSNKGNACYAARRFLVNKMGFVGWPDEGRHYRVSQDPDGTWSYVIIGDAEMVGGPPPKVARTQTRKPGDRLAGYSSARRSAIGWCVGQNIERPTEGEHFRVIPVDGGWTFEMLSLPSAPAAEPPAPEPQKEPTLYEQIQMATTPTAPTAPAPEGVRKASPADNRRIRDALDEVYEEQFERYSGDWSDHSLAEKLDVPRAWVSRVRELYGPDRNDAERLRREAREAALRAKLDHLEILTKEAQRLADVVIESAAKLETMVAEIAEKRKELGL